MKSFKFFCRWCILAFLPFVSVFPMFAQEPWNDLKVMEENKLTPHTLVIPYSDESAIDQLDYYGSPWCRLLNGTWKFKYVDRPADIPNKFFGKKYNVKGWDNIQVPGNIELQGFGVPVYVNTRNEFEANPPYVPTDFNPVGCYVTDFEVPAEWHGRRVVLKFGAVKSAIKLYINGKYVGYSEDAKTPAEFDITKYIVKGTNRLAAAVYRFCDGSYLECQDMWRMSGITRDVVLYSTPKSYIADYEVITDLNANGNGMCSLNVRCELSVGMHVEALLSADGRKVTSATELIGKDGIAHFKFEIRKPKLWSVDRPTLYNLVIRLKDRDNNELELVGGKVGFRKIDFANGVLQCNRIPVTIKGVNRHEHSPFGGHYVTREEMETDVKMMKAAGLNAVRTSHYPDDEYWYELCDRYGILVMDEANNESHGQGYGENSLARRPEWSEAIWYRINNMYMRDRNHPCVFAWSLGNECGMGVCFVEAYKRLKALDKMRPVCHERAEMGEYTDIVMSMYPSPQYLANYVQEEVKKKPGELRRPYIIAEYCHAMGNSLGGLKDYWDTIGKYKPLQGGFIWDWVDQTFVMDGDRRITTQQKLQQSQNHNLWYAMGGDLGKLPGVDDDGAFCANGLVTSDRRPHEHYYEVAALFGGAKSKVEPLLNQRPRSDNNSQQSEKQQIVKNEGVIISVAGYSVMIDTSNGYIVSYKSKDGELLAAPIRYNFWRPPTLNDISDRNGLKCWLGLDRLEPRLVSKPKITSNSISLEYLLISPDDGYLLIKEIVDMGVDGILNVNYVVSTELSYRTLPKLGVQFGLDHAFSRIEWEGNLYETYPDRRVAQKVGMHRQSTDAILGEMHPVPQESGNREAKWVCFSSGNKFLTVYSSSKDFSFSVRDFDDSVLTHAQRIKDLTPAGHYVVNMDYRQSGLGTATCGPGVESQYLIPGDKKYNYRFTFVPSKVDVNSINVLMSNQSALTSDTIFTTHIAPGKSFLKKVKSNVKPDKKYYAKFPKNMTDCRKGVVGDWTEQWSGFHDQQNVVFSLTLDSLRSINELEVGVATAPGDWVIAPDKVIVEWSEDEVSWSKAREVKPINPVDNPQADNKRLRYKTDLTGVKAKYLRLTFKHPAKLPEWHAYQGEQAWLMIDEIEVR